MVAAERGAGMSPRVRVRIAALVRGARGARLRVCGRTPLSEWMGGGRDLINTTTTVILLFFHYCTTVILGGWPASGAS
jgi:hypothetical protein